MLDKSVSREYEYNLLKRLSRGYSMTTEFAGKEFALINVDEMVKM